MVTRLQLGASRLELLDPKVLPKFLDKTWIHLGDKPLLKEESLSNYMRQLREHSISYNFNAIINRLWKKIKRTDILSTENINNIYEKTEFCEFYYKEGDRLPFDDNSINFIFSEHFFEHLFFDEALSLLRECYRILKPFGVIRTCVPDADLRTYLPPEPIGFPDKKIAFTDPTKHKTRWSVYSLMEAKKVAGFSAFPLRYCNKEGEYIKVDPINVARDYKDCPEMDFIFDLTYIHRVDNSLIVDGIKKDPKN